MRTIINFSYTTVPTHTITEEYCGGTLVISVSDTDRGGTTFSTVSAVQEMNPLMDSQMIAHQLANIDIMYH